MKTLLLTFSLCFVFTLTGRSEHYSYTALTTDVNVDLYPTGINNHGDIVGIANTVNYSPAAFRYSEGVVTYLPSTQGTRRSEGLGINAAGTIIGYGDADHASVHAMYALSPGQLLDLDPDPDRASMAVAINDYNYIVGYRGTPNKPFFGNTGGLTVSLSSVLGASFDLIGINNRFDIIGNGASGGVIYNAWSKVIIYLKDPLGVPHNKVLAINQNGVVAGLVGTSGFLYEAGVVKYFGTHISTITGINIRGDVVGTLTSGHAFVLLYSSGHLVDLNDATDLSGSTWTIVSAGGINDAGQICGSAHRPAVKGESGSTIYQGFKLTPGYILYPTPPVGNIGPQVP